jgi:class 3 adenylate cyclase/tetratricopeptide (TPR) repeat protein
VAVCTVCGAENREGARFCDACGAALAAAPPPREQRKTVTVLQCDVTGSTALGERLDPESLRAALARYFETAKAVIESHGGTVEKFVGDAVLAVFGVPAVHEDDALRAVRAAAGIRAAIAQLNEELARDYGATLTLRIGVNTGEVVTGTAERLATGDAVVVAARLEQGTPSGEILLGEETVQLVRGSVEVGPLEHVEAKGKAEPLRAFRLTRVSGESPQRSHDSPFVGRERELRLLGEAWERGKAERAAYLFTVLGSAGVGKSRLTSEFLTALGDTARVVRGRCLAYGEGITYWPVVEILKQLLGATPSASLAEFVLDDAVAASLLGLLGEGEQPDSPEVAAWSVRKLFEAVAESTPLVVVLDDLQWAERPLLDLVEHVADLSRDAPILLLCLARPDLLDRRPGWGGGKLNATAVLLEPLPADDCERLIDAVLAGEALDDDIRSRILAAADGNPLFVEEMLALIRERDDGGEVTVPPSIQALLSARLDQLDPAERGVLERGSVEGKIFHRGAVEALAPDEPEVPTRLISLVRKELVRPDRTQLRGDDAYRFRHLLIRDTAYEALPKSTRAELHERFADWLEAHGAELVELDEILSYHLEQAYRYRTALGPPDERAEQLARRACDRLATAARRANERGDLRAHTNLLGRAVDVAGTGAVSRRLRLELALAHIHSGDQERAGELAEQVREEADRAAERGLELLASMIIAFRGQLAGREGATAELERVTDEAIPLFEQDGDEEALANSWQLKANVHFHRCHYAAFMASTRLGLEHARRAGRVDLERTLLGGVGVALYYGPTAADEAFAWFEEHSSLEPMRPGFSILRAKALGSLGRFDEARVAVDRAERTITELGLTNWVQGVALARGEIELLAADWAAASEWLGTGVQHSQQQGAHGVASTYEGALARSLLRLGRDDEAERWANISKATGASDDAVTQMLWRQALALVFARRGEHQAAEQLAREALDVGRETDMLLHIGDAWFDFADVLELAGDAGGTATALEQALAIYEQKGIVPAIERTRARLAALRAPA